jgi:hypothetical protein
MALDVAHCGYQSREEEMHGHNDILCKLGPMFPVLITQFEIRQQRGTTTDRKIKCVVCVLCKEQLEGVETKWRRSW